MTAADLAADRLITRLIRETFPADSILSEELNNDFDPQAEAVWIIDPLDGTTNFSLGLPFWGVSVARLAGGQPELGAVYFPMLDEMYSTQAGGGALRNGSPIQVKPYDPHQPAAFFSCCTRTHRRYHVDLPYKTRILGSAAYSLCMVARGSALLAFEATPKIWDLAAGWLLVQEAGGVIETLTGSSPFPPMAQSDFRKISFPTLAAADQSLAEQARRKIRPREPEDAPASSNTSS